MTWYVRDLRVRGQLGELDQAVAGPFSLEELREGLLLGRFTLLHLVARSGDKQWRLIGELNLHDLQTAQSTTQQWVIRRGHLKGHATMLGPMAESAVFSQLIAGELSFNDFGWRPGLEQWVRLGDRSEFERQSRIDTNRPIARLDESQVVRKRTEPNLIPLASIQHDMSVKPLEADGEDLVGPPPWMVLMLTAIFISCFSIRSSAASVLEIVPMKLTTSAPRLVIQSDARLEETIEVRVKGVTGQILNLPSFFKTLQLRRSAGQVLTVELAEFLLPQGNYDVEVVARSSGGDEQLRRSTSIFIGQDDKEFRRELAAHIKSLASQHQAEKLALFYGARAMTDLMTGLEKAETRYRGNLELWKKFYADWRKQAASVANRVSALQEAKALAFPDSFQAFNRAVEKAWARADKLNRDQTEPLDRKLATTDDAPLSAEFALLKKAAGAISVNGATNRGEQRQAPSSADDSGADPTPEP